MAAMHCEGPILLCNANTGLEEVLYNSTVLQDGWAAVLAAPNSRTCDELKTLTGTFYVMLDWKGLWESSCQ